MHETPNASGSNGLVAAEMSISPVTAPARVKQIWRHARRSLTFGLLVASGFAFCFWALATQMPRLPASDLGALKAFPPRTLPDIIALRDLVKQYAASFPVQVTIGYCMVYIFMQTFAVPGTLSLSLLSGALYGTLPGLLLVSVISTVGATACYGMSWACGKALVYALWPDKLGHFGAEVRKRQGSLTSYIILLRVTPVLPNTFINVASPMVDLPLPPFMLGTLIGCLPNNFVAVSAGSRLGELVSLRDLYDRRLLLLGLAVSFMALLPIVLKNMNALPQTAEAEAKTLEGKQQ